MEAVTAQSRLVDAATDRERWEEAIDRLRRLESMLNEMDDPPQDPAQVRMAVAQTQYRGLQNAPAAVETWRSLLRDYPDSEVAPQALISLSSHQAMSGDAEAALETLSRVPQEYPNDMASGPVAVLARARLLEREDRWAEASQAYKRIPIDYPLSEAALQSYIDVIGHYERAGEDEAVEQAVRAADQALTEFIDRGPGRDLELAARQRRVLVYFKQDRDVEAFQELLALAQARRSTPQGLQFMVLAAQTAETRLGKTEQAAEIYEDIVRLYPRTETAKLARAEAQRIRSEP